MNYVGWSDYNRIWWLFCCSSCRPLFSVQSSKCNLNINRLCFVTMRQHEFVCALRSRLPILYLRPNKPHIYTILVERAIVSSIYVELMFIQINWIHSPSVSTLLMNSFTACQNCMQIRDFCHSNPNSFTINKHLNVNILWKKSDVALNWDWQRAITVHNRDSRLFSGAPQNFSRPGLQCSPSIAYSTSTSSWHLEIIIIKLSINC